MYDVFTDAKFEDTIVLLNIVKINRTFIILLALAINKKHASWISLAYSHCII